MKIRIIESNKMDAITRSKIMALFHSSYTQADENYINKSISTFRYIALGEDDQELVGFAFGDSQKVSLPQFDDSVSVAMAGIACIDSSQRQKGLFMNLATQSMLAGGGIETGKPFLFVGRMAHAITYRTMAKTSPNTTVPSGSKQLTSWHKAVGLEIANLLGSTLDINTFVIKGDGHPIGFPKLTYSETEEETALFRHVNRSHGDSLLAMCWMPKAPIGW